MHISQVHSISFSPCGGVRRVMNALAGGLGTAVVKDDLTLPKDRERLRSFRPDDLLFIGFPVYGGRAPRNARKVFESLEGNNTPVVLVAVYGNRAFERALVDLDDYARERNFIPVAGVTALSQHVLAPYIAAGRPDERDIALLADFARSLPFLLEQGLAGFSPPGRDVEAIQGTPRGTFLPAGDPDRCRGCGQCAAVCPAGAIDLAQPQISDIKMCIFCSACTKACPNQARSYPHPMMQTLLGEHLKNAFQRKEPTFYFERNALMA